MTTPTSAAARAGASFTPSPAMATLQPSDWSFSTTPPTTSGVAGCVLVGLRLGHRRGGAGAWRQILRLSRSQDGRRSLTKERRNPRPERQGGG